MLRLLYLPINTPHQDITNNNMKIRLLYLLLLFSSICFSQEICDNGRDDDGDGLIDINDPECICNATTVPSIIPNSSFEDHEECPSQPSQLNLATGWVQATEATTDYMNTCGLTFGALEGFTNTLLPFPSGDGIVGAIFKPDWNEYLGSCLTSPMLANTNYQLTFSIASLPINDYGDTCNDGIISYDPVNVTIYGTRDCANLPLGTVFAPTLVSDEWVMLGSALYTPQASWGQLTISFTPATNINAIMMGAPENLPPLYFEAGCLPYFLFDDLTLNESAMFGVNISQTGTFCNNDLILKANPSITVTAAATYQWYKEGIAIPGATLHTYPVTSTPANLAQYTVRVVDGDDCFIAPRYTISASTPAPLISLVQPNCFVTTGTITVDTQSDFYSFDNGVTWATNPVSGPLLPGRYYVKVKTASGCISVANAANLTDSSVETYIDYQTIPPTCSINGSITITSVGSQYSFDGGLTWGTSNTMSLPFGNYNIKIKDSTGCATGSNYAYLPQPYLSQPSVSPVNTTCGSLGSITVNTVADFYSIDGGNTWSTSNTFSSLNTGYYFVKIKEASGCESEQMYIYIDTDYISEPATNTTIIYCEGSDANALTAIGTDILWYTTPTGGIPNTIAPTPLTNIIGDVWYYASQTVRQCEGPRAAIRVTVLETPGPPTATQYYVYCQDEPTTALTANGTSLHWYTTPVAGYGTTTAPIPQSTIPGIFTYYVCQSLNGCESLRIPIEILVNPTPPLPETDKQITYKQYVTTKELKAAGLNIKWYNDQQVLLSEKPVVSSDELGDMVYYVTQTVNDCESKMQKITITIIQNPITIKYPKFFTPNGDSVHETWNINTPDFGIIATVNIFDRYGKFITRLQAPGKGWDGTLNGSYLPSTDYWFTTFYTEYGETKEFRAHFSLVR